MLTTTLHNMENIRKISKLAFELEMSEEEVFSTIIEGDYQNDLEGFAQEEEGRFFSTSNPEQQDSWLEMRAIIHELRPADFGYAEKVNVLGDEVDWSGVVHHTGCMLAGVSLILEIIEDEDDIQRLEEVAARFISLTGGTYN